MAQTGWSARHVLADGELALLLVAQDFPNREAVGPLSKRVRRGSVSGCKRLRKRSHCSGSLVGSVCPVVPCHGVAQRMNILALPHPEMEPSGAALAPNWKVAVVIPCYRVVPFVCDVIRRIGPEVHAIYCVDDGCPDASGGHVRSHCDDPRE